MSVLSFRHNMMANSASRNLAAQYARLADSVRHVSSGLRVEQAADDAAELAIRELMRADMTVGQGCATPTTPFP